MPTTFSRPAASASWLPPGDWKFGDYSGWRRGPWEVLVDFDDRLGFTFIAGLRTAASPRLCFGYRAVQNCHGPAAIDGGYVVACRHETEFCQSAREVTRMSVPGAEPDAHAVPGKSKPWMVVIDLRPDDKTPILTIKAHVEPAVDFTPAAAKRFGGVVETDDYGYARRCAREPLAARAARAIAALTAAPT